MRNEKHRYRPKKALSVKLYTHQNQHTVWKSQARQSEHLTNTKFDFLSKFDFFDHNFWTRNARWL